MSPHSILTSGTHTKIMQASNEKDVVIFATALAAPPGIPGVGLGVSLAELQGNGHSRRYQRITLTAAGACTLGSPVKFGGEVNGVVGATGILNGGEDIVLAAGESYFEVTQFMGTYDFFWLEPASVSASTYSGTIEGIEVVEE